MALFLRRVGALRHVGAIFLRQDVSKGAPV